MVEATHNLLAQISSKTENDTCELEASTELQSFLLTDPTMAGLRAKHVSESDSLADAMSKLSLEHKPQLDLRPLTASHLVILAKVVECLRQPAESKDVVLELKESIGEFSQYFQVYKFLLERTPERNQALVRIHRKVCRKFKVLVMIDLGGSIFLRADKKKDKIDKPGDFSIKAYKYFLRPGFQ
jgi:hypothetical protein